MLINIRAALGQLVYSPSSKAYNGPFRTIATSNTLFHLSLSNAVLITSNGLTFFRYFWTTSYRLRRGLPLGLFPVNLFSVAFSMSEFSARQTCPAHFNLFLTMKCQRFGLLYSCHRFSLVLL